jgi:hypothetical protein
MAKYHNCLTIWREVNMREITEEGWKAVKALKKLAGMWPRTLMLF